MKPTATFSAALLMMAAVSMPLVAVADSHGGKSEEKPMANTMGETVVGEAFAEAEADIAAIDKDNREVTLQTADGQTEVVPVPDDTDLDKLAVGDTVVFGAYKRLSVKVLPPGSAPLGAAASSATAKAKPGETPGRSAGGRLTVVSEVTDVNAEENKVTLKDANGNTQTLDVKNPENQEKLKTLKAGDLVQMDLVEIFGVSIKPKD